MKRNIKVFNYSFILRTIGLGMFNTLFNIYILENSNFSNAFLEKFLAIGNFSMAVSSYFIGFTIDRYNKKSLLKTEKDPRHHSGPGSSFRFPILPIRFHARNPGAHVCSQGYGGGRGPS